jgi:hypothetical protein
MIQTMRAAVSEGEYPSDAIAETHRYVETQQKARIVAIRLVAVAGIWPANVGVRPYLTLAGSSGRGPLCLGT